MNNKKIALTCQRCKATAHVTLEELVNIIGDPIDKLLDMNPDEDTQFECGCGKTNTLKELGYKGDKE